MADLDRGAYTPPTDGAALAFDPRDTRRRRPLPITLILSVIILLILIAVLLFLYRAGTRGEGGEPQPVGDPVGAVREPPPSESQPVDPASGLDVYTDDGAATGGAPVFTPTPEAPIQRTAPAPAPAPSAPAVTGTTGAADVAPARPVATAPAPARPAATPPAIAPAPARPTPTPAARPAPVTPAPAPATPPAATPAPVTPPPSAANIGRVSAQIGAFNTRAQAQAALAGRPGAAGQRIEEVQVGGKTLYRAIATGFRDRDAAKAYCGGSSCIIR